MSSCLKLGTSWFASHSAANASTTILLPTVGKAPGEKMGTARYESHPTNSNEHDVQ